MNELIIRQEEEKDRGTVNLLIEEAFKNMEFSDHQEHLMVERIRDASCFIPELSLVALIEGKIVGHILFTKIRIIDKDKAYSSLALAPVSVLPSFQDQGIGSELILTGHKIAQKLGHESIIVVGHENYYPRFGYIKSSDFQISVPFDAPEENVMAIELQENALSSVSGTVDYPKEFFS